MQRREFLAGVSAAGIAGIATPSVASGLNQTEQANSAPFSMAFAPHFGMFRHHAGDDPVAQLEFAADQGFTAWEDNGMGGRSPDDQTRIAKAMERLGIRMGVFVLNPYSAWGAAFSKNDKGERVKFRHAP